MGFHAQGYTDQENPQLPDFWPRRESATEKRYLSKRRPCGWSGQNAYLSSQTVRSVRVRSQMRGSHRQAGAGPRLDLD